MHAIMFLAISQQLVGKGDGYWPGFQKETANLMRMGLRTSCCSLGFLHAAMAQGTLEGGTEITMRGKADITHKAAI